MLYLKPYIQQLLTMPTQNFIHLAKFLWTCFPCYFKKKQEFQRSEQKKYLFDFMTTWIEFKCLNPVQSFQGGSLLLTTTHLGVPGTLFIDLTMKPPSGVKPANPGLVIGKQIIHYSLILPRRCIKYLKYKLNMITKTNLYPITTSDHSNSISSHHIMA